MTQLKFAVIGAGSSYTPEIIEGLAHMGAKLPVARMDFYDIDPARVETVAGFCRRFCQHLGLQIDIRVQPERAAAIEGAQFVITQIRVGGNRQRAVDERTALDLGVLGQETTGPGGMFKALRTIPPMLEIAREVERINPNAWIINYANPTGILAEAVLNHSDAKMLALCSGGAAPRGIAARALGVAGERIDYRFFGLNHLNFAYDFTIDGRPITDAEFERMADHHARSGIDADLLKAIRAIPISYLGYFFHRQHKVEQLQAKAQTRGEEVQALEGELFAAYADPQQYEKPAALARRGGGGYAGVALGVIDAIHNNTGDVYVVNTLNDGATPYLPANASMEIAAVVNAAGARPLAIPELPRAVWGLVAAVKNYEQLTVEAAVTGNKETALLALLAHPLVGDWDLAKRIWDAMYPANREFLPNFA